MQGDFQQTPMLKIGSDQNATLFYEHFFSNAKMNNTGALSYRLIEKITALEHYYSHKEKKCRSFTFLALQVNNGKSMYKSIFLWH